MISVALSRSFAAALLYRTKSVVKCSTAPLVVLEHSSGAGNLAFLLLILVVRSRDSIIYKHYNRGICSEGLGVL